MRLQDLFLDLFSCVRENLLRDEAIGTPLATPRHHPP
jgi:hypothetical protein